MIKHFTEVPDPLYCPNNCGRCYKGQYRKSNLKRHFNRECGVLKQFECHRCGKRFAHNHHLRLHCINVHGCIILT